jgi:hypothetical protein
MSNQTHQKKTSTQLSHGGEINLETDEEYSNYFNFPNSANVNGGNLPSSTPFSKQSNGQPPNALISSNTTTVASSNNIQANTPTRAINTPASSSSTSSTSASSTSSTAQKIAPQLTVRVNPNLSKPTTPSSGSVFSTNINASTSTAITTPGAKSVNTSNTASSIQNKVLSHSVYGSSITTTSSSPSSSANGIGSPTASKVLPGGTIVIGNIKFPANPSLVMMNPTLNTSNSSTVSSDKKNLMACNGTQKSNESKPAVSPNATDIPSGSVTTPKKEPVEQSRTTPTSATTSADSVELESPAADSLPQNEENQENSGKKGKKGKKTSSSNNNRARSKTCKRWTEAQNRALRDAVLKYGPRNWKKIAAEIGGQFTADQCNQRWHRVSNPRIIKGDWTPEEDDLLFSLVQEFGESAWTKVAETIPGRTDIQCRHRFFQRKKEIELGVVRNVGTTSISSSSTTPLEADNTTDHPNAKPSTLSSVPSTFGALSPKATPVTNRFNTLLESTSNGQVIPSAMLLKQQRIESEQGLTNNDSLDNTAGAKDEQHSSSMNLSEYRKFARQYTNYGKRSNEFSSNDMSAFSYIEKEIFDDNTEFGGTSSDDFASSLFVKTAEDQSLAVEQQKNDTEKEPIEAYGSRMEVDEEEDNEMLEIDHETPVSTASTSTSSSGNPIQINLISNSSNDSISVALTASANKSDATLSNKIEKLSKKSGTLNRMRGNLNVFIPWSESEENILKRECLPYLNQEIPDFATILTNHSSSFHPLHTPDVLKKHFLQLKAAGIDFSDPMSTIPPAQGYSNHGILESELSLLEEIKQKERKKDKKKDTKEPKAKKSTESAGKTKRKAKDSISDTSSPNVLPQRGSKRKAKVIGEAVEDDNFKSTASGRFGAKKSRTKKQQLKKQMIEASTDDMEDRSGQQALFEALNIIGSTSNFQTKAEEQKSQHETSTAPMSTYDAAEMMLLSFSNYIVNSSATNDSNETMNPDAADTLEKELLSNPKTAKLGERNITFPIISDNGVPSPFGQTLTTSSKITIKQISNYIRKKLALPDSKQIVITVNGRKVSDQNLKLDRIMSSYDINLEELELHYSTI